MINHDRPTVAELLDIIAETLKESVVPATAPHARHQARVAANLASILKRQVESEQTDAVSLRRLEVLLDLGTTELGIDHIADALRHCSDEQAVAALPTVMAMVRHKLAVAKPGYDLHDATAEAAIVA